MTTLCSGTSEEICAPATPSNAAPPCSVDHGARLIVYFGGIRLDLASGGRSLRGGFAGRMAISAAMEKQ